MRISQCRILFSIRCLTSPRDAWALIITNGCHLLLLDFILPYLV